MSISLDEVLKVREELAELFRDSKVLYLAVPYDESENVDTLLVEYIDPKDIDEDTLYDGIEDLLGEAVFIARLQDCPAELLIRYSKRREEIFNDLSIR